MQGRVWGNEYRTTLVCVDTYDRNETTGRLYNPYFPEGETFQSLIDFLRKMERLLDSMQFPQPFTENRAFGVLAAEPAGRPADSEIREGKRGTFAVRVIFRQNASWQGSITWLEKRQEQSFRSALELIFLMDNALSQCEEKVS